MLFCILPGLSPLLSPGPRLASTHQACPQPGLVGSSHKGRPRSSLYLLLSEKITGKTTITTAATKLNICYDTLLWGDLAGESWVLVPGGGFCVSLTGTGETRLGGPWGPHAVFVSLKTQAPSGGHPGLGRSSSADTLASPASLWSGPHPWLREAARG